MAHFGPELFAFLDDLAENNDREWFQANKGRYETHLKEPALQFIRDLAPRLARVSPHLRAIPKATGGSLLRIYRDTRFGTDKRPYKTHVGLHFCHEAGEDAHAPGFYVHIEPGQVFFGAGVWMPPNPVLNRIRDRIVAHAEEWAAVRTGLEEGGFAMMGREGALKRVPRGYAPDHVHGEDLKLRSIGARGGFEAAAATRDDFIDVVASACARTAPLSRFVCAALDLPF